MTQQLTGPAGFHRMSPRVLRIIGLKFSVVNDDISVWSETDRSCSPHRRGSLSQRSAAAQVYKTRSHCAPSLRFPGRTSRDEAFAESSYSSKL